MADSDPTLQDVWSLLGTMNRRMGEMNRRMSERFDVVEQQLVAVDARVGALEAKVTSGFGALKESIEARDFCLDDHGRRLTSLEESVP